MIGAAPNPVPIRWVLARAITRNPTTLASRLTRPEGTLGVEQRRANAAAPSSSAQKVTSKVYRDWVIHDGSGRYEASRIDPGDGVHQTRRTAASQASATTAPATRSLEGRAKPSRWASPRGLRAQRNPSNM